MKKIIFIFFMFIIFTITAYSIKKPLIGKKIVLDAGHGGVDKGTIYNDNYEKDINLNIVLKLEKELINNGAKVLLIRDDDYDLSSPNAKKRKRSDFDNRIKIINESNSNMYLSIHTNYLHDQSYSGAQVFYYKDNKILAEQIQMRLNTISYPRKIKQIPNIYMYEKLKIPGVLIEVGFISNKKERELLLNEEYQIKLVNEITKGIIEYYK